MNNDNAAHMTTEPMTIRNALAVCVEYIRHLRPNGNVWGVDQSISLADLDGILARSQATGRAESLIDVWLSAMATSSIHEGFAAARVITTGVTFAPYCLSELEGYIDGLNDGLKMVGASQLVEIETIDVHGDRIQIFTGWLGEVAAIQMGQAGRLKLTTDNVIQVPMGADMYVASHDGA